MKGIFESYDENTGKGTIVREYDRKPSAFESLGDDNEIAMQLDHQYYYFNIPQEHAHKMKIELGASVEFDLVKEGAREVTNLRF